ncbi:MMPL family transporter [Kibdelosporangium phytohabitans]|uniref:MMPL family transporter n=1 Tax=Kibdelosporangium phytohabitans TaxID=860235 RepID=UPI0019F371A3|nr:MMPL family transporter [Kibdelosporangium phytohabitans]MBE1461162.1 RND superfamily putative drug exporter [Kibdelosporangium phytohabitans]
MSAVVGGKAPDNRDFLVGEAGRAEALAMDAGMLPSPRERVLISPADQPEAVAAAREVTGRVRALPGVAEVASAQRSADGGTLLVAITLSGDIKQAKVDVGAVAAEVRAVAAARPGLRIEQTGSASNSLGVNKQLSDGLLRAEMITLPVTLLILFVVFGSIVAAGVPLLLALSSVGASMGLYTLASHVFPDAGGAVANVILMIGLAVGVDYSLFYLKRAREERARSRGELTHRAAIELAAATAGRTVVVSGLAVLVAVAGLYLTGDIVFSSIATGSIIVVLVSVASSLTVLPALLVVFGRRADPGRVARRWGRSGGGQVWPRMVRAVLRRPAVTLLVGVTALVVMALPAAGLRLKVEGNETFSRAIPEMQAYDRLVARFPAEGVSHLVVVRASPAQAGAVSDALVSLAGRVGAELAGPARPRVSADGTVSTLELPIAAAASSQEGAASLQRLRSGLVADTVGRVPGAEVAVSGGVARNVDYVGNQSAQLPWVLGFVLLLTFLTILVAFRSVVLAVVGTGLNILSAGAAFGVIVAVFQNTWAEGVLGFTSAGFVGAHLPLIFFVILFGLSMDYQVFVLSRIKEARDRGLGTREAVVDGISGSANMVSSAAVVMVSVFASFVFIDQLEMKQIGFGLAFAVLLDAAVVRILILPALLALLGERTWWPSRRRRAVERPERPGFQSPASTPSR